MLIISNFRQVLFFIARNFAKCIDKHLFLGNPAFKSLLLIYVAFSEEEWTRSKMSPGGIVTCQKGVDGGRCIVAPPVLCRGKGGEDIKGLLRGGPSAGDWNYLPLIKLRLKEAKRAVGASCHSSLARPFFRTFLTMERERKEWRCEWRIFRLHCNQGPGIISPCVTDICSALRVAKSVSGRANNFRRGGGRTLTALKKNKEFSSRLINRDHLSIGLVVLSTFGGNLEINVRLTIACLKTFCRIFESC